jgi:hypothetical protein
MNKKTRQKPVKKLRKKIVEGKIRKINKPIDKTKLAFQEIRKDFKRLKKSKQKMQFLWYRTKKEHVALMKDLDKRIKMLKAEIKKKKTEKRVASKKRILGKAATKKRLLTKQTVRRTAVRKKIIRKRVEKEVPKIIESLDQPAADTSEKELTKE